MTNNPFRGNQKIGRNDPCFCGSGRKHKRCHGRVEHAPSTKFANDRIEKEIIEQGKRHFEKHKAQELQRQKQQGLGRPIISIEYNGYRFVAIGSKLHYGKWKTFADFLGNYIKQTLGGEWGNAEIAKPLIERHPVMQWYEKICHLQTAHTKEPGALFSTPMTGAVSAYNRLAYNLYLIAHNGKDIQTRLIARLKNKGNFQGAFFETQVAAWLINAGFELAFEDETDGSTKHCEFTATYLPTGEKYSVEAKSRATKPGGSVRTPVGKQLRAALAKKADHRRLVFIDLNKALHTREEADRAFDRADQIIGLLEAKENDEIPAPPAYVCITNMNDQYALDSSALAMMILFRGFKIHDFMGVEFSSLREAARARERHWPMFQLFKSIEKHREIPQTFGGELPSEVFITNPLPRLQVGQFYAVPGPDGMSVNAKLQEATVLNDKACCILYDPETHKTWIATFDMTSDELADYAKYPDTYFGVYKRQNRKVETAMDMFDFFVEGNQNTSKEQLIQLLHNYADQEGINAMSQKELVELTAEMFTASAIANGFAVKTLRNNQQKPEMG